MTDDFQTVEDSLKQMSERIPKIDGAGHNQGDFTPPTILPPGQTAPSTSSPPPPSQEPQPPPAPSPEGTTNVTSVEPNIPADPGVPKQLPPGGQNSTPVEQQSSEGS